MQLNMEPAEYRIYTTVKLDKPIITSTLSYEELTEQNFEIKVFPNPSNDIVNVEIFMNDLGKVNFKIIDEIGRVVLEENKYVSNKETPIILDISKLAPGRYCLLLDANNSYANTNFVKQ